MCSVVYDYFWVIVSMSCVVYQTNKKTGYVYAYESVSYRDPVTRMPKSKRTFIGRVDPITKELLDPEKAKRLKERRNNPTAASAGKRSNSADRTDVASVTANEKEELVAEIQDLKEMILQQHNVLAKMQKTVETSQKVISALADVFQNSESAH